ncbi:MAG: ABC transporter ATP-binding protein [Eubacterium sp.]|nr:ABC transporter ATP-binding protein [Eubacterium sp.]
MADNLFEIKKLSFCYDKVKIIDDLSLKIDRGGITTIIGANGCGKSTLFNLMTGNLKQQSGEIIFLGKNLSNIKLRDLAKKIAIVHQYNSIPFDITVEKLVSYGRIPYGSCCMPVKNKDDDEKIKWAMAVTGIYENKKELLSQLSGGQRQRAWISMSLAQGTDTLLLDEPTTFLDVKHQIEILKLTETLNVKHGMSIIMVLHDMNQALRYSSEIIALKSGKVVAQGNPEKIINKDLLRELYNVELDVVDVKGKPFVLMV